MSADVEIVDKLKKILGKFYKIDDKYGIICIGTTATGEIVPIRVDSEGRLEETGIQTAPFTSKFAEFKDQVIGPGEWLDVLQYTSAGQVEEFFILSPNTNFKVQVAVDGAVVLEKTYDELREVQQNSRDISAFAELDENGDPTGFYVASIRNIPHAVSIQVKVQNTGASPITLPNIFVKYKTLGE
jgi:hypothetical protein